MSSTNFRQLLGKHTDPLTEKRTSLVMINDPGKDLDDEQAFVLAAALHKAKVINLHGVVANLEPSWERAGLAKGTFNELGLPYIRVGRGSSCFKGGQNLAHETDAPYAKAADCWDGHELLCSLLYKLPEVNLVLMSGLTDATHLFTDSPDRFLEKVKSVTIMGGVLADGENVTMRKGPDGVNYLVPEDAANNAFDWPATLFLYQALQEHRVPLTVVMRHAVYSVQFPFSLYDRFAETGNPIGINLLNRQKPSINQLWCAANSPAGSQIRGKLPLSRDRQWFVKVFCGGTDPSYAVPAGTLGMGEMTELLPADGDVWPFVDKYNQYDPMALVAAVPQLRDRYFDPITVEVKGITHRIIGLTPDKNGIKDGNGLRDMMSEMEIAALRR